MPVLAIVDEAIAQMRAGVAELEPPNMLVSKRLGDDDARAIARALLGNTTLTRLNLALNSITAVGASHLAAALSDSSSSNSSNSNSNRSGASTALAEIRLEFNSIGDAGAAAFAAALEASPALAAFNFRGNGITGVGTERLGSAIRAHPFCLAPIRPEQRMALVAGHFAQQCALARLPLDMVRRIATRYKVAQGRRVLGPGTRVTMAVA
jgi:hypothetical protein